MWVLLLVGSILLAFLRALLMRQPGWLGVAFALAILWLVRWLLLKRER